MESSNRIFLCDVDTSRRSSLFSVSEPVRRGSGAGGSPDGERVPRWTRVEVMVEEAVNLRSPGVYYVLYRWPQVPAGELGTAVSRCSEKGAAVWQKWKSKWEKDKQRRERKERERQLCSRVEAEVAVREELDGECHLPGALWEKHLRVRLGY